MLGVATLSIAVAIAGATIIGQASAEPTEEAPAESSSGAGLGEVDASSVVSEKILLLREPPRTSLSAAEQAALEGQFDMRRFDLSLSTTNPAGPEVLAWCDEAVAASMKKIGMVDENGDPIITLEAKIARCSQVILWRIEAEDECNQYFDSDGDRKYRCQVRARADVRKYAAVADGGFRLVADNAFGPGGRRVLSATGSGSGNSPGDARTSAATSAGRSLWLEILKLPPLQLRAPVEANRDGYTLSCLGRDTVSLDQPFLVLKAGTDERVGFVKARRIYDGCVAATDQVEGLELRPMEAQNILGGSSIRAGNTMRELPSIGLAVGGHAGVAPLRNEAIAPTGGVRVEQNLARVTGISELHAVALGRFAVSTQETYGSRAQVDIGLLKRWYLAGPLFFELAGMLTVTLWPFDDDDETLETFGVIGAGGLGLQVSPRWTVRAAGGGRFTTGFAVFPDETGPVVSLDIMYGF